MGLVCRAVSYYFLSCSQLLPYGRAHTHPFPPTDPDECADDALNDCDPNAVCTNEKLSFSCACKEGFVDAGAGLPGRSCTESDGTPALEEKVAANAAEVEELKRIKAEKAEMERQWAAQEGVNEDWTAVSVAAIVLVCFAFLLVFALFIYVRRRFRTRAFNYGIA